MRELLLLKAMYIAICAHIGQLRISLGLGSRAAHLEAHLRVTLVYPDFLLVSKFFVRRLNNWSKLAAAWLLILEPHAWNDIVLQI